MGQKMEVKVENVESVSLQKNQNEDKMEVENESHDINITVLNDANMGFHDDELNEEHIVESSKHIELTKDEVTMTMNDLQMELMKHENEKNELEQNDVVQNMDEEQAQNVDLSFMDVMNNGNNNEK